jgi:hypothetical protein
VVNTGLKAFQLLARPLPTRLPSWTSWACKNIQVRVDAGDVVGSGPCKGKLVIYDRANVVLVQYKEGNDYGALLSSMAI